MRSHALEDRTVAVQLLQLMYGSGMGQGWRSERCSCSKADCPFPPFLTAGLPAVSAETFFGFTECVDTEGQPDNLNAESLLWPQQDRKVGHLSGS